MCIPWFEWRSLCLRRVELYQLNNRGWCLQFLWVLIVPQSQFLGMAVQEGTSSCGLRDHRALDQAERINFHSSPVLQFYGVSVSSIGHLNHCVDCHVVSCHFTVLEVLLENLRISEFQHFKS